jgi:uncharacterized membrane protein
MSEPLAPAASPVDAMSGSTRESNQALPAARLADSPSLVSRRREIGFPWQGSCFRETDTRDDAPFACCRRPGGPNPNTITAAVFTPMKRAIILAAMAISVLAESVAAVRADFRLCNNSASRLSISLAYTDGETWVSEGWWNLKPSGCETLVRGALAAEYYYVYAMDEHGGEWKGKAFMCTRDREFRIIGREDCFVRGFDRTGFFEVDTGKEAKNWTVQLTDSTQGPPNP